jgi:diphthine synthase
MVFYIVGLGLGSPEDITIRGLNAIKASQEIYLEHYTSIMGVNTQELGKFLGRELIEADRDFC